MGQGLVGDAHPHGHRGHRRAGPRIWIGSRKGVVERPASRHLARFGRHWRCPQVAVDGRKRGGAKRRSTMVCLLGRSLPNARDECPRRMDAMPHFQGLNHRTIRTFRFAKKARLLPALLAFALVTAGGSSTEVWSQDDGGSRSERKAEEKRMKALAKAEKKAYKILRRRTKNARSGITTCSKQAVRRTSSCRMEGAKKPTKRQVDMPRTTCGNACAKGNKKPVGTGTEEACLGGVESGFANLGGRAECPLFPWFATSLHFLAFSGGLAYIWPPIQYRLKF